MLTEKDFEKETEHGGAQVDLATDDYLGDLDDSTTRVKLPVDAANGNRSVSGLCAICLCPYSTGEKITWSPEISCQHAFHKECIIQWLAKKEELKCPVCRQDYCQPIHVDESFPGSEDLFLDSFALALNYARSHASRSWAGEVSRGSGAGSFAFGFDPPVRVHVMGGNNDLSLRDHSEGVSQDIEMGPTVSSERSSAPPPLITESNAGGGEAVDLSTTVDIVDDREQHLETATENSNGGEPAMEDAVISNMVEGITIAQHQETSADASLDGEEGMENVAVTDAGDTNGVAEQLSRKDS